MRWSMKKNVASARSLPRSGSSATTIAARSACENIEGQQNKEVRSNGHVGSVDTNPPDFRRSFHVRSETGKLGLQTGSPLFCECLGVEFRVGENSGAPTKHYGQSNKAEVVQ